MDLSSVKLARATASALAAGAAIAISSFGVVRAEYAHPAKAKTVFTCSKGTACLEGDSTSGTIGVYGVSATGTAIVGVTSAIDGDSAIGGISYGTSGFGNGVYGYSANGAGVYGASAAPGGDGLAGVQLGTAADSGNGLYGESASTEGAYQAIYGQGDNAQTWLFYAFNTATGSACAIDPLADLECSGSTESKTVHERHLTSNGRHVLTYATQSASATLEDVGTSRMVGGIANVAIERNFGSTIDASVYHVFLTPEGDASLYVAQKTPLGFVVRETHGGHSTLDFDYRIVARPIDAKSDRLPPAAPMHTTHTRKVTR